MILAGDFIDAEVGLAFGLSTMSAAAVGNTLSDVVGIWISGVIETCAAALGLPDHGLSNKQRALMLVRIVKNVSMITGIVIGCILGMFPLVFPDEWRLWASRAMLEEKASRAE
eukprot:TRINITY_DN40080_c0_g1_i2.p1 TRINITY_DN40080_c0_g1~~TRINITY_DN40080_c0_g1_i2.p1  ORF type:complete len:113 (-),score=18.73 TRINITY_DN40080_c0_g1_i2:176-514(-)